MPLAVISIIKNDNTKHEVSYGLAIPRVTHQLTPEYCFDCVYELEISLTDECGEEQLDGNPTQTGNQPIVRILGKPGEDFDVDCETDDLQYSFLTDADINSEYITAYLDRGKYTLSKTIKISNNGFEYYLSKFVTSSEIKTKEEFVQEALIAEDTTDCEISCSTCLLELGSKSSFIITRSSQIIDELNLDQPDADLVAGKEYDALAEQCDAICFESAQNNCDAYLALLLIDVMPKGQYASYSSTDLGVPTYLGLLNKNTPNGLSFNYSTRDSSGTIVPMLYTDNNGTSITIEQNGNLVSPAQLSEAEFIRSFDESWAHSLVKYHPEYCKYTECLATEGSLDYNNRLMAVSTFQEALDSGFLDPFGGIGRDTYFEANTTAESSFKSSYHNNYYSVESSCDISILEMALLAHYSNHSLSTCTSINSWIAGLDYTTLCDDRANAVWEMYRGLYIAQKQKFFIDQSTCSPSVPSDYAVRFPDPSQYINDSTDYNSSVSNETEANTEKYKAEVEILASCDTFCNNQAEYWLYKLGGCDLSETLKNNLIDEFTKICKNGCDENHPMGSRNTPGLASSDKRFSTPYNSFQDAFVALVPANKRKPGSCDVWSINMHGNKSTIFKLAGKPDSCYFDNPADTCFTNANPDTKKYIEAKRLIDDSGCEDCIDCDEFQVAIDAMTSYYGGFFRDSTWEMKLAMTNYLNVYFGFNLTYFEYDDFRKKCHQGEKNGTFAYSGKPVHPIEQVFDTWELPYLGEWMYASSTNNPPSFNELNTTSTEYYLDTCVCNQLQDYLDDFALSTNPDPNVDNSQLAQNINDGIVNQTEIDAFSIWFSQTTQCIESFTPGSEMPDIMKSLLKCRNLFGELEGGDLGDSDASWSSWSNEMMASLSVDNTEDSVRFTLNGTDCIQPCSPNSGKNPALSNIFWTPVWTLPIDSNPCVMFDLEGLIDSILNANFSANEMLTFENCFRTSFCNLMRGDQTREGSNMNNCWPSDSIGAAGNRKKIADLYDDIWTSFNDKYDDEAERTIETVGFSIYDEYGNESFYTLDSPSIFDKMRFLKQEYCYDPCGDGNISEGLGGGIYRVIDTPRVSCCGQETIYFDQLLSYLNGLTETKNCYGNQLTPRFPYSIFPSFDEYYNSVFYKGYHPSTIKITPKLFRYPIMHFALEDSLGDNFETVLSFTSNHDYQAKFHKIVSFDSFTLIPSKYTETCEDVSRFLVYATQLTNNGPITIKLRGSISKFNLYDVKILEEGDTCSPSPMLCNKALGETDLILPDPCMTWKKMRAATSGKIAYDNYIDSISNDFKAQYYDQCMSAKDSIDLKYELKEYHYTLYYYDQAGNLTQTVPPAGVDIIASVSDLESISSYRRNSGSPVYPSHTLKTRYQYNSLNEVRWQSTPDGGISEFWYDRLGRMAISQNAEQNNQAILNYSYTTYDDLGRINEVGQLKSYSVMSKETAFDSTLLNPYIRQSTKEQITRTWYDTNPFVTLENEFYQENLRGRVACMAIYDVDDTIYNHAIHYNYDIHGNVKDLMRENVALREFNQSLKHLSYDYDLVSGNVNKVSYQQGKDDQFYHRYQYDADNRLTKVETSVNDVQWDRDAKYDYHLHGPLSRSVLGELQVQGIDYAYTIHGWLKGVNRNSVVGGSSANNDIGQDGVQGTNGANVARDVFGFSLHYYDNDYAPISGNNTSSPSDFFLMQETATSGFNNSVSELFNGNISL